MKIKMSEDTLFLCEYLGVIFTVIIIALIVFGVYHQRISETFLMHHELGVHASESIAVSMLGDAAKPIVKTKTRELKIAVFYSSQYVDTLTFRGKSVHYYYGIRSNLFYVEDIKGMDTQKFNAPVKVLEDRDIWVVEE